MLNDKIFYIGNFVYIRILSAPQINLIIELRLCSNSRNWKISLPELHLWYISSIIIRRKIQELFKLLSNPSMFH